MLKDENYLYSNNLSVSQVSKESSYNEEMNIFNSVIIYYYFIYLKFINQFDKYSKDSYEIQFVGITIGNKLIFIKVIYLLLFFVIENW